MQNVNITLNGLHAISAEYALTQGVESGKGHVLIEASKVSVLAGTVNLRFHDGVNAIEISNLQVVEKTLIEAPDGNMLAKFELSDNRRNWESLRISGRFNVTESDGENFVTATLKNGVEYTLKDLFEFCFSQAEETVDCELRTLSKIKPVNIVWNNVLLTEALQELLAIGDVNICCGVDGRFKVLSRTVSESVEYNQNVISVETVDTENSAHILGKIRIIGGRTWCEKELSGSWTPVCISDGTNGKIAGEIYDLSAIAADWGLTLVEIRDKCLGYGGFDDIPGSSDEKRVRRQILQRCAYKWYRYSGVCGKLPWLSHRAQTDSNGKTLPIKIKHTFFRLKSDGAQAFADPYENITTPTETSYTYNIDCERGIIKFRDVQGVLAPLTGSVEDTRLKKRTLTAGAEILATIAWKLESTEPDGCFEFEKTLDTKKKHVFTLRRDDLRLRQLDNGVSVTDLNRTELENTASELVDEIAKRFASPVIKRIKYAGYYICSPSGAIKTAKYHASVEHGLTTEVEIENIPQLPKDLIIEDKAVRISGSDSSGEERELKQVNAYSVGPVVIKADDAILPESMSFVKASGTPDNIQLKELGVLRNPFFWERENGVGGWITLSLATVITGSQPYYMVKESDENGAVAQGSKGIDVTNLQDSKLDIDDLVIVFETHNGHKVAFPLNKTLVCDHKHDDEHQDNISTEVSNGDVDDEKIGDFDDIFWIKCDSQDIARLMLSIKHEGPQAFYTGDGEDDAVAVLGGKNGVLVAPKDCELHVLGQNKDKQPVIEGHVTTEANYYQDKIGDGPINFVQSIRVMADDPLGKYHKADMWWDYNQKKWIPWYQTLWQKIPPTIKTPPTYPPTTPPYDPPISQPVDSGAVITPNHATVAENAHASEGEACFLGCFDLPWRGLILGEYNEHESLPGVILQGDDCFLAFKVPEGKNKVKVQFDDGVEVKFKENVKVDKNLVVEGAVTGGNSSDTWLRRDGQNSPSANVDWGGFQILNLCHVHQKDDCKHYFGDGNDTAISYDSVLDCLKIEGKDICASQKVKTQDKFSVSGNDGLSGTLFFDNGSDFCIAMTFAGGILVGQTIAGSSGEAGVTFE